MSSLPTFTKLKNIRSVDLDEIFLSSFLRIEKRYKGSLEKISDVDEIFMLLSDQNKKSLLKASKLLDKLNIKTSDADILLYSYILLKYHTKKVINIKIKQKVKNVILHIENLLNKI
jgi:hypothetical protein